VIRRRGSVRRGRSDQQGARCGTTKQIKPEVIQIRADLMEPIKALRKQKWIKVGRGEACALWHSGLLIMPACLHLPSH
jgi:hypothetical protein